MIIHKICFHAQIKKKERKIVILFGRKSNNLSAAMNPMQQFDWGLHYLPFTSTSLGSKIDFFYF